jgi:hypothetical protein
MRPYSGHLEATQWFFKGELSAKNINKVVH